MDGRCQTNGNSLNHTKVDYSECHLYMSLGHIQMALV